MSVRMYGMHLPIFRFGNAKAAPSRRRGVSRPLGAPCAVASAPTLWLQLILPVPMNAAAGAAAQRSATTARRILA